MIASASLDGEHTSSLTASARVLQSLADDLAAVIIGAAANVDGGGDEAVAGQAFVEHATVLARGAFLRGGDILHPSNSLKDTKADAPAGWMQGESGGGARTIAHAPLARVLELVRVLNQHDRIVSDTPSLVCEQSRPHRGDGKAVRGPEHPRRKPRSPPRYPCFARSSGRTESSRSVRSVCIPSSQRVSRMPSNMHSPRFSSRRLATSRRSTNGLTQHTADQPPAPPTLLGTPRFRRT